MSIGVHNRRTTHSQHSPVFVVGSPRSGTSLTCRLLRGYLGVSFGTESQFIVRYHQRLRRYGDLAVETNLVRLLTDINRERFFRRTCHNWGWVLDRQDVLRSIAERTYSGVLRAIFTQLADYNGMTRWGDKTPEYSAHLPLLRQLFPDAQFIHVVRDGRDVALSLRKTSFGPKNPYVAAQQWAGAMARIRTFGRSVPAAQFMEIRYETLTERPCESLESIAAYLGVVDPNYGLALWRDELRAEVIAHNSSKWRAAMPRRDVEIFEATAGGALAESGYDLFCDGSARRPSLSKRLYLMTHDRTARALNAGHLADDWYKLCLRTRMLTLEMRSAAARVATLIQQRRTPRLRHE
jgi:hypothetical protein